MTESDTLPAWWPRVTALCEVAVVLVIAAALFLIRDRRRGVPYQSETIDQV